MVYPIFLKLGGKRCVVVGGGRVAERRIAGLLDENASVEVVSPEITHSIREANAMGRLTVALREYCIDDLANAFLVIAATNNDGLNDQIASDADQLNILVCQAGEFENGNFLTGAGVHRDPLHFAISTSGLSPTLASILKQQVEVKYGPEWSAWTRLFGALRSTIQASGNEAVRKMIVTNILIDTETMDYIFSDDLPSAEKAARRCILSHLA